MTYDTEEAAEGEQFGRTVVGLFSDRERAQQAIRALGYAGFGDDRVEIATQDGGALVTVEGDYRLDEALSILRSHGANLDPMALAEPVGASVRHDDRRQHDDLTYPGPERRLAEV